MFSVFFLQSDVKMGQNRAEQHVRFNNVRRCCGWLGSFDAIERSCLKAVIKLPESNHTVKPRRRRKEADH